MKPLHSRPRTPGPLHGSLLEASEANRSADSQSQAHLQSRLSGSAEPHSASNLFLTGQPKGYYELKKMYGRSRYNGVPAGSLGSEKRFELPSYQPAVPAQNLIIFDKQVPREKKRRAKNAHTTPFYNPNYDFVQKDLAQGVPLFDKQSSRKPLLVPKNCLNEYDLQDVEKGAQLLAGRVAIPHFDKMFGRKTLDKLKAPKD